MRILVLTILFAATFFYFRSETPVVAKVKVNSIDSIKVKVSAPHRIVRGPSQAIISEKITETQEDESIDREDTEAKASTPDLEHVEEVQWTDLEQGWSTELKEMLSRLEPAEAELIHKNYLQEQESYQAELDGLTNEKQQKASPQEVAEVDQLISQLDEKHQERLKEVLGAHYEAVRDGYETFMSEAQPEE